MTGDNVLVKGKPGTGKPHAIKVAIQQALDNGYRVACATPTSFLQNTYRAEFIENNFEADPIHSTFRYPVNSSERAQINWNVGKFDLLIVEELSMVPKKLFLHVVNSLNQLHVRPVALLCRDQQQQQPIQTVEGRTTQTKGILYVFPDPKREINSTPHATGLVVKPLLPGHSLC